MVLESRVLNIYIYVAAVIVVFYKDFMSNFEQPDGQKSTISSTQSFKLMIM